MITHNKQRGATSTIAIMIAVLAIAGIAAWQFSQPRLTAPEYLARGLEFVEAGDFRAALIEFKNALQRDPDHVQARWQLAKLYVEIGDGAAAAAALDKAKAAGMQGPEFTLTEMRALILQGNFDTVSKLVLKDASAEQQTLFELLQAEAHLGLGEIDLAEATFQTVATREPGNDLAHIGYARAAFARRDFSEGDARIGSLLERSPHNVAALLLKGESALAQQQFELAQQSFSNVLDKHAEHPAAQLGLARALIGLQNPQAVLEQLDLLSAHSPNAPRVIYFKALARTQTEDFAAAKSDLLKLLNMESPPAEALLLLGRVHYQLEEYQQAEQMLGRVLQQAPGHIPTRKFLAATQMKAGRPADAVETLQRVLNNGRTDAQLLAMLGSAYLRSGQNDEGTRLLREAAELAPDVAAFRTQLAVSHLLAGSLEEGIGLLEASVDLDSDFVGAELLLVYAYLQQQNYKDAVATAQRLTQKQPDSPIAHNLLGAAYLGQAELDKARAQFTRVLELQPDFVPAAINFGRLEERAGNMLAAKQRYQTIIDNNPNQPDALVAMAELAAAAKRGVDGIYLLDRAREHNPRALKPRLLLGNFYLGQRNWRELLKVAQESQAIAPNNAVVLTQLGQAQRALGETDAAVATLNHLVEIRPDSPAAHYQLALAQAQSGSTQLAETSFAQTLSLSPEHLQAKLALGELKIRTGDLAAAYELAARVQSEHPKSAGGFALQGATLLADEKPEQALALFQQAFEQERNGVLLNALYRTLLRLERPRQAHVLLQQWLSDNPKDVAVRLQLGGDLLQSGDDPSAIAQYEKILESSTGNLIALNNLAVLYQRQADPRALEFAERAYALGPENPDVIDTFGWQLIQAGKLEQGLALLSKAMDLVSGNTEIRYHHAVALTKTGDERRGREELEALLATDGFAQSAEARELLNNLK